MLLHEIEPHKCITGELLQRVKAYNNDLQALQNDEAELIATRKSILEAADPFAAIPGDFSATRERLISGYFSTLKRKAELAAAFRGLAADMADAAEKALHAADEESSNVLQKVIGKMAEAGITVKSMLGWGKSPRVAQTQLEHQARTSNDFKEAHNRALEIREFSKLIKEQSRESLQVLEATRDAAKRVIEKAVTGDSAGLQLM